VIEGISGVGSGNVTREVTTFWNEPRGNRPFACARARRHALYTHDDYKRWLRRERVHHGEGFVKLLDNYDTWHDSQTTLIGSMKTAFNAAQTLSSTVEWAVLEVGTCQRWS